MESSRPPEEVAAAAAKEAAARLKQAEDLFREESRDAVVTVTLTTIDSASTESFRQKNYQDATEQYNQNTDSNYRLEAVQVQDGDATVDCLVIRNRDDDPTTTDPIAVVDFARSDSQTNPYTIRTSNPEAARDAVQDVWQEIGPSNSQRPQVVNSGVRSNLFRFLGGANGEGNVLGALNRHLDANPAETPEPAAAPAAPEKEPGEFTLEYRPPRLQGGEAQLQRDARNLNADPRAGQNHQVEVDAENQQLIIFPTGTDRNHPNAIRIGYSTEDMPENAEIQAPDIDRAAQIIDELRHDLNNSDLIGRAAQRGTVVADNIFNILREANGAVTAEQQRIAAEAAAQEQTETPEPETPAPTLTEAEALAQANAEAAERAEDQAADELGIAGRRDQIAREDERQREAMQAAADRARMETIADQGETIAAFQDANRYLAESLAYLLSLDGLPPVTPEQQLEFYAVFDLHEDPIDGFLNILQLELELAEREGRTEDAEGIRGWMDLFMRAQEIQDLTEEGNPEADEAETTPEAEAQTQATVAQAITNVYYTVNYGRESGAVANRNAAQELEVTLQQQLAELRQALAGIEARIDEIADQCIPEGDAAQVLVGTAVAQASAAQASARASVSLGGAQGVPPTSQPAVGVGRREAVRVPITIAEAGQKATTDAQSIEDIVAKARAAVADAEAMLNAAGQRVQDGEPVAPEIAAQPTMADILNRLQRGEITVEQAAAEIAAAAPAVAATPEGSKVVEEAKTAAEEAQGGLTTEFVEEQMREMRRFVAEVTQHQQELMDRLMARTEAQERIIQEMRETIARQQRDNIRTNVGADIQRETAQEASNMSREQLQARLNEIDARVGELERQRGPRDEELGTINQQIDALLQERNEVVEQIMTTVDARELLREFPPGPEFPQIVQDETGYPQTYEALEGATVEQVNLQIDATRRRLGAELLTTEGEESTRAQEIRQQIADLDRLQEHIRRMTEHVPEDRRALMTFGQIYTFAQEAAAANDQELQQRHDKIIQEALDLVRRRREINAQIGEIDDEISRLGSEREALAQELDSREEPERAPTGLENLTPEQLQEALNRINELYGLNVAIEILINIAQNPPEGLEGLVDGAIPETGISVEVLVRFFENGQNPPPDGVTPEDMETLLQYLRNHADGMLFPEGAGEDNEHNMTVIMVNEINEINAQLNTVGITIEDPRNLQEIEDRIAQIEEELARRGETTEVTEQTPAQAEALAEAENADAVINGLYAKLESAQEPVHWFRRFVRGAAEVLTSIGGSWIIKAAIGTAIAGFVGATGGLGAIALAAAVGGIGGGLSGALINGALRYRLFRRDRRHLWTEHAIEKKRSPFSNWVRNIMIKQYNLPGRIGALTETFNKLANIDEQQARGMSLESLNMTEQEVRAALRQLLILRDVTNFVGLNGVPLPEGIQVPGGNVEAAIQHLVRVVPAIAGARGIDVNQVVAEADAEGKAMNNKAIWLTMIPKAVKGLAIGAIAGAAFEGIKQFAEGVQAGRAAGEAAGGAGGTGEAAGEVADAGAATPEAAAAHIEALNAQAHGDQVEALAKALGVSNTQAESILENFAGDDMVINSPGETGELAKYLTEKFGEETVKGTVLPEMGPGFNPYSEMGVVVTKEAAVDAGMGWIDGATHGTWGTSVGAAGENMEAAWDALNKAQVSLDSFNQDGQGVHAVMDILNGMSVEDAIAENGLEIVGEVTKKGVDGLAVAETVGALSPDTGGFMDKVVEVITGVVEAAPEAGEEVGEATARLLPALNPIEKAALWLTKGIGNVAAALGFGVVAPALMHAVYAPAAGPLGQAKKAKKGKKGKKGADTGTPPGEQPPVGTQPPTSQQGAGTQPGAGAGGVQPPAPAGTPGGAPGTSPAATVATGAQPAAAAAAGTQPAGTQAAVPPTPTGARATETQPRTTATRRRITLPGVPRPTTGQQPTPQQLKAMKRHPELRPGIGRNEGEVGPGGTMRLTPDMAPDITGGAGSDVAPTAEQEQAQALATARRRRRLGVAPLVPPILRRQDNLSVDPQTGRFVLPAETWRQQNRPLSSRALRHPRLAWLGNALRNRGDEFWLALKGPVFGTKNPFKEQVLGDLAEAASVNNTFYVLSQDLRHVIEEDLPVPLGARRQRSMETELALQMDRTRRNLRPTVKDIISEWLRDEFPDQSGQRDRSSDARAARRFERGRAYINDEMLDSFIALMCVLNDPNNLDANGRLSGNPGGGQDQLRGIIHTMLLRQREWESSRVARMPLARHAERTKYRGIPLVVTDALVRAALELSGYQTPDEVGMRQGNQLYTNIDQLVRTSGQLEQNSAFYNALLRITNYNSGGRSRRP